MGEMKRCSNCGVQKEATTANFRIQRGKFLSKCKECYRECCRQYYRDRYLKANPQRKRRELRKVGLVQTLKCASCGDILEANVSNFKIKKIRNRAGETCDSYHSYCRRCSNAETKNYKQQCDPDDLREAARRWQAEHPETGRAWRLNNPERVREYRSRNYHKYREARIANSSKARAKRMAAEGDWNSHDVYLIIKSQSGKCYYCDNKVGHGGVPWHVDHFIPLSRGGTNYPENLVVACASCNLRKHNKMPWEFAPERFSKPD